MKKPLSVMLVMVLLMSMVFGSSVFAYAGEDNAIAIMVEQDSFDADNVGGDDAGTLLWTKGNAYTSGGQLLFTDDRWQAGAVVKRNQVKLTDGFSTYFQMYFSGAADGIAFVLYQADAPVLGDYGGALGYGDLENIDGDNAIHDSIIVEFDTWNNGEYDPADSGSSHVAIMVDGDQVHDQQSDNGAAIYNDAGLIGNTINAWVDYSAGDGSSASGTVTVTFGTGATKTDAANHSITRTIETSDSVPVAGDSVFIGFTSSTGINPTTHKLLKWYFKDSYLSEGLDPTENAYTQAPATLSVVPDLLVNPVNADITIKDDTGAALTDQTFLVYIDDVLIPESTPGEYTTGSEGAYSFAFPSDLSVGSHVIRVVGQGGVTNFASFSVTDVVAPVLTAAGVTRTSDTQGTVTFTSDEAGSYYYAVVEDGGAEPVIDTSGEGIPCTSGETVITDPAGLEAGAKDIYIIEKDSAGNLSNMLMMDIAEFSTAPPEDTDTTDDGAAVVSETDEGQSASPSDDDAADTGDSAPLAFLMFLMAIGGAGAFLSARKIKN